MTAIKEKDLDKHLEQITKPGDKKTEERSRGEKARTAVPAILNPDTMSER